MKLFTVIAILLTLSVQTLALSSPACSEMQMAGNTQMHSVQHMNGKQMQSNLSLIMQNEASDCCDSECKCSHNINSNYLSVLSLKLELIVLTYPDTIIFKPVIFQSNQDKSLYRPPILA
ncbi:hypothetical protein [Catenovulum maritimum]|uniref:DUF2946 domain-containing protein n=1 Tax=Catenovulum maritimum TaxID=1513271 RepID=A0A0J8JM43_9ALTE|nr:hypothetical protein [Catenovulum maritimum]KMT65646.1 hypothetical protein XM47_08090 [Catenovulum maritimum]